MQVITYGTRGSLPVAGSDAVRFGGNTTCLRIISGCIPDQTALVIDAGTGFLPMSQRALETGISKFLIFHTHYHHDHTQGILIAPPIYIKAIPIEIYGPVQNSIGPRQVYERIMEPPLHPISLKEVGSHVNFRQLIHPCGKVILIHPEGGVKTIDLEQFERIDRMGKQIFFREHKSFSEDECLVIRMLYTDHPENTICYRFEERPTGKVFVFLTDEENRDGLSTALKQHVSGADLLIQDAQYDREKYDTRTAGFGHGTPDYVVRLAKICGVKMVGLTHHDPMSSDADIEAILAEGQARINDGDDIELFACKDSDRLEV